MRLLLSLCLVIWSATTAMAVTPEEMLDDPVLEARAQAIGMQIRCPVCQGEPIEESRADIAGDLRVLVRERLVAGDTDDEVIDYIAARYGDTVRLNPPAEGAGLILWLAGPALILIALGVGFTMFRKTSDPGPAALSDDEQARLAELTGSSKPEL